MQPTEQGRFCANCRKTVVDYTALSDQELVRLLSKPLTTNCGRFRNEQLDRPLPIAQPAMGAWRQWAGLLTMSLLGWQTARAQLNEAGSTAQSAPTSKVATRPTFFVAEISNHAAPATYSLVITGRVLLGDTTGTVSPVANANVLVTGSETLTGTGKFQETRTDSTGSYSVSITMSVHPNIVRVAASTSNRLSGHMSAETSPQQTVIDLPPLIIDQLRQHQDITGGGICIVQPPTRWQRLKRKLVR